MVGWGGGVCEGVGMCVGFLVWGGWWFILVRWLFGVGGAWEGEGWGWGGGIGWGREFDDLVFGGNGWGVWGWNGGG